MNNITEQELINNLLSDENLSIDWKSVLHIAKAKNWQVSTQIRQKIFEDFLRYPADDIKKIIVFFAMNSQQQIEVLPVLNKQTLFNFSDGDLRTDRALLALANQYMDMINSLSNRIMILDLEEKLIMVEAAVWDIYAWIDRQNWDSHDFWTGDSLFASDWQFIREVSKFLKQYLNIEILVTQSCLEQIIDSCLHP